MKSLSARHLTLRIGQQWLCKNMAFHFKAGEIWGILGPNGSGKTTFLQTLAGLKAPQQGEVMLDHQPLHRLSKKIIAQSLAILFQDTHFHFSQTVWEYCCFARFAFLPYFSKKNNSDITLVEEALATMELLAKKNHCVMTLSGGEKRRLSIACILAQTPAIFLLDEPTNHLDLRQQMRTLAHFKQLAKNQQKTIIMSLHDINLAQHFCDYLLLLLPDGNIKQGQTQMLLNEVELSALYCFPITANSRHLVWHPKIG